MAEGAASAGEQRLKRRSLVALVLALGCEGGPSAVPCREALECPVVDEEPSDTDLRAEWLPGQQLTLWLDGYRSLVDVISGEVVLAPDPEDPECTGPCAVTLKRLRIGIEDLVFASPDDAIDVTGLEVALRAPIALERPDGAPHAVPIGTEVMACATAAGLLSAETSALIQDLPLSLATADQALSLEASVPIALYGTSYYGCVGFDLLLEGRLEAAPGAAAHP